MLKSLPYQPLPRPEHLEKTGSEYGSERHDTERTTTKRTEFKSALEAHREALRTSTDKENHIRPLALFSRACSFGNELKKRSQMLEHDNMHKMSSILVWCF